MGYTKLFNEIIMSTVWREPDHVRILWITMLAIKDRWHVVNASLPGLADAARISLQQCEEALEVLSSPDPYSRSTEFEGRRVKKVDGGWQILNGEKYRNKMSIDERREYNRLKQREYRAKAKEQNDVKSCVQSNTVCSHTYTDTKAETKEKKKDNTLVVSEPKKKPINGIPFQAIVDNYHEILPTLPKVKTLTANRKAVIKARWNTSLPDIETWQKYFRFVAKSDFLTGRTEPAPGHSRFRADLEWLTKESNFVKIWEGRYHGTD